MTFSLIKVHPISECLGAEIKGIDLRDEISQEQLKELKNALSEYGVIFLKINIYHQKTKFLLQKNGAK